MIVAIAGTHTAIWYLFSDSRLGHAASDFIDRAIGNGDHIGISAISLAEIVYLIERAYSGNRLGRGSRRDRRSEGCPPASALARSDPYKLSKTDPAGL